MTEEERQKARQDILNQWADHYIEGRKLACLLFRLVIALGGLGAGAYGIIQGINALISLKTGSSLQ